MSALADRDGPVRLDDRNGDGVETAARRTLPGACSSADPAIDIERSVADDVVVNPQFARPLGTKRRRYRIGEDIRAGHTIHDYVLGLRR